jgi:hypothetical protein
VRVYRGFEVVRGSTFGVSAEAGRDVVLSALLLAALFMPPPGATLSRHPFQPNPPSDSGEPVSQRRAKIAVSQNADSRAQCDLAGISREFVYQCGTAASSRHRKQISPDKPMASMTQIETGMGRAKPNANNETGMITKVRQATTPQTLTEFRRFETTQQVFA